MKIVVVIFICFFSCSVSSAQLVPVEYSENTQKADSFYEAKQFLNAGKYYNKAFRNKAGYSDDYHRLLAGISWSKAGNKDSAMINLYVLIYALNFSDYNELHDSFLNSSLATNPAFKKLELRCLCQQNNKKKPYISALARLLDSIYMVDQSFRSKQDNNVYDSINVQVTSTSQESNLRVIDSIYVKYGWLSVNEVGYQGVQVQFLVIQHADLTTQKKWKPIIKKAVDDCLLAPENYALLIDRILNKSGKKQIYGTQLMYDINKAMYIPCPIENPDQVDERRAKLGMTRLNNYLSSGN